MTCWHPKRVITDTVVMPPEVKGKCKKVALAIDFMFINNIPILLTVAEQIKFTTAERLTSSSAKVLSLKLENAIKLYRCNGFYITIVLANPKFESLRISLLTHGITLNTTSAGDHIPDIKRHVQVVKKCVHSQLSTLPFHWIPILFLIKLMTKIFYFSFSPVF